MLDLFNTLNYCADLLGGEGIPEAVGGVIHLIVIIIQVVVPILLIIWGMIDFVKAIVAQNEEKTKEAQKVFLKRLIAAVVCFLIVTIVQLIINVVASIGGAGNDANSAWTCAAQLINGNQDA